MAHKFFNANERKQSSRSKRQSAKGLAHLARLEQVKSGEIDMHPCKYSERKQKAKDLEEKRKKKRMLRKKEKKAANKRARIKRRVRRRKTNRGK